MAFLMEVHLAMGQMLGVQDFGHHAHSCRPSGHPPPLGLITEPLFSIHLGGSRASGPCSITQAPPYGGGLHVTHAIHDYNIYDHKLDTSIRHQAPSHEGGHLSHLYTQALPYGSGLNCTNMHIQVCHDHKHTQALPYRRGLHTINHTHANHEYRINQAHPNGGGQSTACHDYHDYKGTMQDLPYGRGPLFYLYDYHGYRSIQALPLGRGPGTASHDYHDYARTTWDLPYGRGPSSYIHDHHD